MVGLVLRLLVVGVALLAALAQPTAATAAPGDSLPGTALTGVCPVADGVSKDVTSVYPNGGLWAPYTLRGLKSEVLGRLFPYEVSISGVGLKSRHFVPGETYTKSGPRPANLVECTFDGVSKDGAVHIEVLGVVRR